MRLAADLVKRVHDHLFGRDGVRAAADFLEKKKAPSELVRELDPNRTFDPEEAIRAARERGAAPDARSASRPGETARTTGVDGILDRLVERRTASDREKLR